MTKQQAYAAIESLVNRFEEQYETYKKDYNETQVRRDFIDPFFKALGWDMDNSLGYAEAYRDVIHEDKIKISGAMKAPDYSFRVGGKRLFFVEAKKPSVLVKTDIAPAYQLRRYAWSAKLSLSLLTDFEELAVYDCTKKPGPTDKASVSRIKYLTYQDYLQEFDFIWDHFSKESVLQGKLDKFIAADKNKRGTTTVDKEFLANLDGWRILLAQNIALRNTTFTEDELNFAVQQTIDRLIFLRIAEDRGIEDYETLKKLLKGENIYLSLFSYFEDSDTKYNSGLFDLKKDNLSKSLVIDNRVLKEIINELYYPLSPYEFSVLSVEILGSAYEQFLGKQIKLSAAHRAVIEEKPEVRKSGGVYYTPEYIVEYIVRQTVGKLTENKTPDQVAKLRILDPACGSGSFLLGAYEFLLNWHRNYYMPEFVRLSNEAADTTGGNIKKREAAVRQRNKIPLRPDGNLTTALKKQILLNNIYGVDIDTQAVEVTKLSLLLKCMEGETRSSMTNEMRFGERVLPTLDSNIKNGNSLIDLDFYEGELDFDSTEEKRVKPFSWEQNFKEVFRQGGFDAVIGNPPYIPIEFFNGTERKYYTIKFTSLNRKYDSSALFILNGLKHLSDKGILGFISTQTWQTGENYNDFRKYIFSNYGLTEILNLPFNIFADAYVDTAIYVFSKQKSKEYKYYSFPKKESVSTISDLPTIKIKTSHVEDNNYKIIFNPLVNQIKQRLSTKQFVPLGEISISTQGLSESRFTKVNGPGQKMILPFFLANVRRYSYDSNLAGFVNLEKNKSLYPYYTANAKILIRRIINRQDRLDATYFDQPGVFKKDLNPFLITNELFDPKYVLALINSKFFSWLYINTSSIATKDDFRQTTLTELRHLPIKIISTSADKSIRNEIIKLVNIILKLNDEKKHNPLLGNDEKLQHRIEFTNDKLDQLVYELYCLSQEEINFIEK